MQVAQASTMHDRLQTSVAEGRARRAAAAAAAPPAPSSIPPAASVYFRLPLLWGRDESMPRQGICGGVLPTPWQRSILGGTDCVRALHTRFAAEVCGAQILAICLKSHVHADLI